MLDDKILVFEYDPLNRVIYCHCSQNGLQDLLYALQFREPDHNDLWSWGDGDLSKESIIAGFKPLEYVQIRYYPHKLDKDQCILPMNPLPEITFEISAHFTLYIFLNAAGVSTLKDLLAQLTSTHEIRLTSPERGGKDLLAKNLLPDTTIVQEVIFRLV